jgi:hypothetical protein
MKSIVELAKEKVKSRREELDALKEKAADADVLVSELGKVRDKLPKEAKDTLDKHAKKSVKKK